MLLYIFSLITFNKPNHNYNSFQETVTSVCNVEFTDMWIFFCYGQNRNNQIKMTAKTFQ